MTIDADPMKAHIAKALLRQILETGTYWATAHARQRMEERGIDDADIVNVLHGGWVGEAEMQSGRWRYPVETNRFRVVVEFESESEFVVVTVMRHK